jgi:anti-sigma regulatory factor (Ser/Thr protein kinase)
MNAMAVTLPTELLIRRVLLAAGPTAAAEARGEVREAICAWDVPVDLSVAVLLTCELVTNAIRHETSETVTLAIDCSQGQLRIDVHDSSGTIPVVLDTPDDAETGRGLVLVATLSDEWGFYRTPAGKAVYFTLGFQPDLPRGGGPRGSMRGDGEP